jgi:hypothetical protein
MAMSELCLPNSASHTCEPTVAKIFLWTHFFEIEHQQESPEGPNIIYPDGDRTYDLLVLSNYFFAAVDLG